MKNILNPFGGKHKAVIFGKASIVHKV